MLESCKCGEESGDAIIRMRSEGKVVVNPIRSRKERRNGTSEYAYDARGYVLDQDMRSLGGEK